MTRVQRIRAGYDPTQPVTAACPACTLRTGHVIHPACPICHGAGTITLGRRALAYDTPETVAQAIRIVLETAARAAIAHPDRPALAPGVLPATLNRLHALGLIEEGTP